MKFFLKTSDLKSRPGWWKYYDETMQEWQNDCGGWHPVSASDIILFTVEAKDWEDLFNNPQVIEKNREIAEKFVRIPKEHAKNGWIAPNGEFFGCHYGQHDLLASLLWNKAIVEIEKEYVRIQKSFVKENTLIGIFTGHRLTKRQQNTLWDLNINPEFVHMI